MKNEGTDSSPWGSPLVTNGHNVYAPFKGKPAYNEHLETAERARGSSHPDRSQLKKMCVKLVFQTIKSDIIVFLIN